MDFEVSEASHDLERLRALWASVVLVDLPMPRIRGLAVLRSLRGTGDGDPEVIILTHDHHPDALASIEFGGVDLLVRPLGPDAVHTAVEEIIRRVAVLRSGSARRTIFVAVPASLIDLLRAKQAYSGPFDEAQRLLQAIIAMDSGSAAAHNLMGMLHENMGRRHASYRSFQAALRADREYEPALENLPPLRSVRPRLPTSDAQSSGRPRRRAGPIRSLARMRNSADAVTDSVM